MTLQVMNQQFFEWNIPEELQKLIESGKKTKQEIIDEYFCPNKIDLDIEQISDDYYEELT